MENQNKKLTPEQIQKLGISPAIIRGYDMPRSEITGKAPQTKGLLPKPKNTLLSQESIDSAIEVFRNGSVADFIGIYLSKFMNAEDHKKSLILAQDILTTNVKSAMEKDNPYFVKIVALDIAHNALEYGHRLFKTACVLDRSGELPPELRFMFWGKINPAYYRESDRFETCEKLLKEPLKSVPDTIQSSAFDGWIRKTECREYLSWMHEFAGIEFLLIAHEPNLLDKAIQNMELVQRIGRGRTYTPHIRIPFRRTR